MSLIYRLVVLSVNVEKCRSLSPKAKNNVPKFGFCPQPKDVPFLVKGKVKETEKFTFKWY